MQKVSNWETTLASIAKNKGNIRAAGAAVGAIGGAVAGDKLSNGDGVSTGIGAVAGGVIGYSAGGALVNHAAGKVEAAKAVETVKPVAEAAETVAAPVAKDVEGVTAKVPKKFPSKRQLKQVINERRQTAINDRVSNHLATHETRMADLNETLANTTTQKPPMVQSGQSWLKRMFTKTSASKAMWYGPGAILGAIAGAQMKTQNPETGEMESNPGNIGIGTLAGLAAGHIAGKKIPEMIVNKKMLGHINYEHEVESMYNQMSRPLSKVRGVHNDRIADESIALADKAHLARQWKNQDALVGKQAFNADYMTPAEIDKKFDKVFNTDIRKPHAASGSKLIPEIQDLVTKQRTDRIDILHDHDMATSNFGTKLKAFFGISDKHKDKAVVRNAVKAEANKLYASFK